MLTNTEIKRQIKEGNIKIDNLRYDALIKPNSCELYIEDSLYIYKNEVLDSKEKEKYLQDFLTGKQEYLQKISIPNSGLLLETHKIYLAQTKEKIKTTDYIPIINGTNSLSLLGVSVQLNNEYKWEYYDGRPLVCIVCTKPTWIYPETRVANATFFKSNDNYDFNDINYNMGGMLSGAEIKKRMENKKIIIEPQDKIVINPNSVNLTLNEQLAYYTEDILDIKGNNPIEIIKIDDNGIVLLPNQVYIGRTNEWTETYDAIPEIDGRSSLGRLGYHAHCTAGLGSIGYKGVWTMGLRVVCPLIVYKDMKCCQISYYEPEGEVLDTYNGPFQNIDNEEQNFYQKVLKYQNKK